MKVVICGSRKVTNYLALKQAVAESGFEITEVVSGGAIGVDRLGERWAHDNNIPIKRFLPDWEKYGKRAGVLRNVEMVDYADATVAIWDGQSRGTKHSIEYTLSKGKPLHIQLV